jgi:ATPase subunit of ABC transporter with duplicated ATPase domains
VLLVSHDRALLDAVADRLLAVESHAVASYPGGWADYVRTQEEGTAAAAAAPPPPKPKRERKPARRGPSQLELVEAEVARTEERVAELERKLAADWSDLDLVAAHRRAREDLARLLERWEALFEQSSEGAPSAPVPNPPLRH